MFSHTYKAGSLHGYFDKPECTAILYHEDGTHTALGRFKSYRAAQLAITRAMR